MAEGFRVQGRYRRVARKGSWKTACNLALLTYGESMAVSSTEVLFLQLVDNCIARKISKEQALQQLETLYKSIYKDIKNELGKDHISFYCYALYKNNECDFDKWVEICDGAERSKPLRERKYNEDIIQRVIDKYSAECKRNDLESGDCVSQVYSEVHQIQNICRENKELTELYEKYKAEIKTLQESKQPQIIEKLGDPQWVKKQTERTLKLLCLDEHIVEVIKENGTKDYHINSDAPTVQEFLKTRKELGIIELPEIDDIDIFMIREMKSPTGNPLNASIRMIKNRKK